MSLNLAAKVKSIASLGKRAFFKWRDSMRSCRSTHQIYKAGVLVPGFFFVVLVILVLAILLAFLPGPLTIPPVLLGLYLWPTEFVWAGRFLKRFKKKPKSPGKAPRNVLWRLFLLLSGLVLVVVGLWLVSHYGSLDFLKR